MIKYKKKFLILSLIPIFTANLLASDILDPEIMDGWLNSQKKQLNTQCMTMLYNEPSKQAVLPTQEMKVNVCECFAYEYMSRFTYKEFLTNRKVEFRRISKAMGKYEKEVLQTSFDRYVDNKWKDEAVTMSKVCGTEEIIENGINYEDYDYYK